MKPSVAKAVRRVTARLGINLPGFMASHSASETTEALEAKLKQAEHDRMLDNLRNALTFTEQEWDSSRMESLSKLLTERIKNMTADDMISVFSEKWFQQGGMCDASRSLAVNIIIAACAERGRSLRNRCPARKLLRGG